MKLNFKISEFNISGNHIPEKIADKILKWHILPMQDVRNEFGKPIYPSQKSGYRSISWELSRGRNGKSQHTFRQKGAVDWTCMHFGLNKDKLLELIIENTDYTRIAVYNSFLHCDYKPTKSGQRELYTSNSASKWVFDRFI